MVKYDINKDSNNKLFSENILVGGYHLIQDKTTLKFSMISICGNVIHFHNDHDLTYVKASNIEHLNIEYYYIKKLDRDDIHISFNGDKQ